MLQFDFQSSVGHSICMAAHLFERQMQDELEPMGITFRQVQILAWLAIEAKPLSQVQLAERMNIEPPSLVATLDRMQRDELITRDDCPDDRRKKMIRPLKKAETVWNEIVTCAERVRQRASAGLSEEELATLHRLLGRVRQNLCKEAKPVSHS
jgi:MarR family transcriptional regulator for hemolysin